MSQRKDGMCSRCKDAKAYSKSVYCGECRRAMVKPGTLCSKCLVEPRYKTSPYCQEHKREYERAWYASRRDPAKIRKIHTDACNCGNANCNGMSC